MTKLEHPQQREILALLEAIPHGHHNRRARTLRLLAIHLEHGTLVGKLVPHDAQWFGISRRHIRGGAYTPEFVRFFERLEEVLEVKGCRYMLLQVSIAGNAPKQLRKGLPLVTMKPDEAEYAALLKLRPAELAVRPSDTPREVAEAIWWHYFYQLQTLMADGKLATGMTGLAGELGAFVALQTELMASEMLTQQQREFWRMLHPPKPARNVVEMRAELRRKRQG